MNRTNRFKENSPATASFFDRLRSIPAVSGEIDCMDELGRLDTPYLHHLEAIGGRNRHLRRSQGRRLQICSLAPELLEVVKSSHPSSNSVILTPEVLNCCSWHPATKVLKLYKINLFKLFSKIVLFIYF